MRPIARALRTFLHAGRASVRARTRAQVLLKLGEGWSLPAVCRAFDVCRNTVVCARFIEISVFECGCLSRPVSDMATLQRRVALA